MDKKKRYFISFMCILFIAARLNAVRRNSRFKKELIQTVQIKIKIHILCGIDGFHSNAIFSTR